MAAHCCHCRVSIFFPAQLLLVNTWMAAQGGEASHGNGSGSRASTTERLANFATVLDERLRAALGSRASAGATAMAAPAAVLGGLFGATLLGALSYRRSAKRLVRQLPAVPVTQRPPAAAGLHGSVGPTSLPPKASELLTKGEMVYLFVAPGFAAAALIASLGAICRWALDVDSFDDAMRQSRWLCGSGPRPARVGTAKPAREEPETT